MKLDELRRGLDDAARRPEIDLVDARAAVGAKSARRRRQRRQLLGVAVVVIIAAIAIPVAEHAGDSKRTVRVTTPSTASVRPEAWAAIKKKDAGLGSLSSFSAITSTGTSLLLAGTSTEVITHPAPLPSQAAIWYSDDGITWHDAHIPAQTAAKVNAIATSGDTSLAIGSDNLGRAPFVWRSNDDGRTWNAIGRGAALFGSPAPQMGRPFVDGLLFADGIWIASGGGSSGYGAIWTSTDGQHWEQRLDSRPGNPDAAVGSVHVIDNGDGQLIAYGGYGVWESRDGTHWGKPAIATVPQPFFLLTVAPGGNLAFGGNGRTYGRQTPLLRRADDGHDWSIDPTFLAQYPGARVANVTRQGNLWFATGTSGTPNHPDAWFSFDGLAWNGMPAPLYGASDGATTADSSTLSLAATLGHRAVFFGTTPELDRYYTLDAPIITDVHESR